MKNIEITHYKGFTIENNKTRDPGGWHGRAYSSCRFGKDIETSGIHSKTKSELITKIKKEVDLLREDHKEILKECGAY